VTQPADPPTPPPAHPPPAPAAATPAAPAPPAPATTADPSADPKVGEPGWLKARLDRAAEQAKKETRKELKAERRAVRAAGEEAARLKATAEAEVAAAKTAVDAILAQVPEAERAAIAKAGAGSTAKTLEAFSVWQAAKGINAPANPPTTAQPPPATPPAATPPATATPPIAPPATTSPPPAPPPPAPGAPEDIRRTYEDLRATNPYMAAQYLLNHQGTVFPDRTIDQVKQSQQRR
jgi:hypothetical protein